MKYLILGFMMLITGCNTVPVQVEHPVQQEILLQRCTEDTPLPMKKSVDSKGNVGYDGTEVLNVLIKWDAVYSECATRMDALINLLRKTQDPNLKITVKE